MEFALAEAVRIARRASSSESELLAPAASKLRACKGCQKAKTACNSDERPCARCVRMDVSHGPLPTASSDLSPPSLHTSPRLLFLPVGLTHEEACS